MRCVCAGRREESGLYEERKLVNTDVYINNFVFVLLFISIHQSISTYIILSIGKELNQTLYRDPQFPVAFYL